ncbi:hypothetical protein E5288_WYG020471 [Bos mutus]|uniref:Uncharacterized protein n=1 Tax=Bos mutus TaxID=72004 RepID=A0A6B0S800_9CETA|nr:hypothetical protein [Bos mutus]
MGCSSQWGLVSTVSKVSLMSTRTVCKDRTQKDNKAVAAVRKSGPPRVTEYQEGKVGHDPGARPPSTGGGFRTAGCGPLNRSNCLICEIEEKGGRSGVCIAIPYPRTSGAM